MIREPIWLLESYCLCNAKHEKHYILMGGNDLCLAMVTHVGGSGLCLAMVTHVGGSGLCLAIVTHVGGSGLCLAMVSHVRGSGLCRAIVTHVGVKVVVERHHHLLQTLAINHSGWI